MTVTVLKISSSEPSARESELLTLKQLHIKRYKRFIPLKRLESSGSNSPSSPPGTKDNHIVTIRFSARHTGTFEKRTTGENSSVETTRPARTEIRHDFLASGDLLRVKLNENYLNIPSVSTTERISKLKRRKQ